MKNGELVWWSLSILPVRGDWYVGKDEVDPKPDPLVLEDPEYAANMESTSTILESRTSSITAMPPADFALPLPLTLPLPTPPTAGGS